MRIDDAFLEGMAQHRLRSLSVAMGESFREHYPKECRLMGKDGLKRFCDICTQKAYGYGAENFGELKSYATLAWVLGIGFDDDPLYPWIAQILAKEEPFEWRVEEIQDRVFEVFYFSTLQQLQEYEDALQKLLQLNFATIKKFTNYTDVVNTLERIYPQRVKVLGGKELLKENLKRACYEKTVRYNIDHPIGVFVYAGLVFFLGHKVDDDPLYGWAKKYLNSEEPRMAHKLDRLVKVIEKRVRNIQREIKAIIKELK